MLLLPKGPPHCVNHIFYLLGDLAPQSCIPDKVPNFVGRQEECKTIQNHLAEETTRVVNVWGPPGFGKTSVAINVAHELKEKNISVFFVPVNGMSGKEELVSKLLSIFANDKRMPHISSSHWLIQCLQRVKNPFILILDNADDLLDFEDAKQKNQDVLHFIAEILTQCSHIKLLLTTRRSLDFLCHSLSTYLVKTNALDEVSSMNLIKILLPGVSENDRRCIMKECEQVPLAIRLMCNIMKEENISINDLVEELRKSSILNVLDSKSFPDDLRLKTLLNKSFQRLPIRERKAFVSLTVFPGWFNTKEATAVLDGNSELTTKKIIRFLEQNALIDVGESFSRYTINSHFRSFVQEQRHNDETIEATFLSAQHLFHDYYISCFRNANEKFLKGSSNEALATIVERRESIFVSLHNGLRDDDLYPRVVEILSMAELFLYALLTNEGELFEQLYDTAVKEAKKRQNLVDEVNLLAAKSFHHWGWFSLDGPKWDFSQDAAFITDDDIPAKLFCYHGVYQLLCGNREEGITFVSIGINRFNGRSDENVLNALILYNFVTKEEKENPVFEIPLEQCIDWWETRCAMYFPESDENTMTELLENEDLFFFTLLANLVLTEGNKHSEVKDAQDQYLLTQLLKTVSKSQAQASSGVPRDIYPLNVICNEPLETMLSLVSESEQILNDATLALLEPLYLRVQEFTNHILLRGVCSQQSYDKAKQLMESALHLLETFSDIRPSLVSEVRELERNISEYFGEEFTANGIINSIIFVIESIFNWSIKRDFSTDFLDLARSYDNLGKLKSLFIDNGAALESHRQAITIREEHTRDHIDTVESLTNIGCIYFKMSNAIEAERAFKRALDLRKMLDVHDHEDTANIYASIAKNHYALGNYEEALKAHLETLTIRKKYLGKHQLTAKSLDEAGRVYLRLQNYQEALQFCEQALNMKLDLLGEDVETAESLDLLGCVHFEMNNSTEDVLNFEEAAEMRSKLLGVHKDTACSYHNLGLAQHGKGDLHGALESLQKAVDMRSKLEELGEHKDTACSYHWLGTVYHEIGDPQGALVSFQEAVDIRSKVLGDHQDTATSHHRLGVVYRETGDSQGALVSFQEAADIRSKELGDHEYTAQSYNLLGGVQRDTGDLSGALCSLQKAADIRSKLCVDHKETAHIYNCLGELYLETGDSKRALISFQQAADMRSKELGDHEETASSYHSLGVVQRDMGDLNTALCSLRKAADMRSKVLGDHKDTANSYHSLGSAQQDKGDHYEAMNSLQKALNIRSKVLGDHEDTAKSYQWLGMVQRDMGDLCGALESLQEATDMGSKKIGDPKDVATSYHLLGLVQYDMQENDQALESLQKAWQLRNELLGGNHPDTVNTLELLSFVYEASILQS